MKINVFRAVAKLSQDWNNTAPGQQASSQNMPLRVQENTVVYSWQAKLYK